MSVHDKERTKKLHNAIKLCNLIIRLDRQMLQIIINWFLWTQKFKWGIQQKWSWKPQPSLCLPTFSIEPWQLIRKSSAQYFWTIKCWILFKLKDSHQQLSNYFLLQCSLFDSGVQITCAGWSVTSCHKRSYFYQRLLYIFSWGGWPHVNSSFVQKTCF